MTLMEAIGNGSLMKMHMVYLGTLQGAKIHARNDGKECIAPAATRPRIDSKIIMNIAMATPITEQHTLSKRNRQWLTLQPLYFMTHVM